ncbi:hypothetical protein [Streptomyces sp. NPDC051684]|uniref:hypothetical protein n=1 Tax=Streptomyces sp. NPDC051684 TaxID=3365670 RepID=UPI00379397E2
MPVLGLIVTLITQTGNGPKQGAPATAATTAQERSTPEASATSEANGPPDADASTVAPSPSPSQTAAKILKTGDFTLVEGDNADLEHGVVGKSVKGPDISLSGGDFEFAALNGRLAEVGAATPASCEKKLKSSYYVRGTGNINPGLEGTWYCVTTSVDHIAAVEWLGDEEERGTRFHYIVWDVPAPPPAAEE